MLWQCLHFPRFAIELHDVCNSAAVAIFERKGSRRHLIACNDVACEAGLHRDMDVVAAQARVPALKLLQRSRQQERNAFKALATWAQQFSSVVFFDAERWLLWIEVGASLHYFGNLTTLNTKIKQGIEALNYSVTAGIAPTPEAAALLAHYAQARPILKRNDIVATLSPLPLHLLKLPDAAHAALHEVGWKYIGEVLQVPHDQLARRFGPSAVEYLQHLLGDLPDPREPYRVPATYKRGFELMAGVHAIEAMLFPLRRMLGELQGYLRSRDTALQQLQLQLIHEHAPATIIELRTTAPQRDAQRLLLLLRETLERTALPEAVIELIIVVDQFVSMGDTQQDLFSDTSTRDRNRDWCDLLDKLRARLGESAIKRLGLRDDHLPEKAWCVLSDDASQAIKSKDTAHSELAKGTLPKKDRMLRQAQHERKTKAAGHSINSAAQPEPVEGLINKEPNNDYSTPQRPLWLIEPTMLHTLPHLLGKPERIETGWWTGTDARRDYYIADTAAGSRWWLYRDADSAQWYLHGLWA